MLAGVMFWLLGAYASFILKYTFVTFCNVKKLETKNSRSYLYMLGVHEVLP
jgi:hypothetical protein